MPRYEVEIEVDARVWVELEADSEDQAIAYAKESYRIGDAQWYDVANVTVTELDEDEVEA